MSRRRAAVQVSQTAYPYFQASRCRCLSEMPIGCGYKTIGKVGQRKRLIESVGEVAV